MVAVAALFVLLTLVMVWVVLPAAAIGLALYPARRMAGTSRRRWASGLGSVVLSYVTWVLFAAIGAGSVAAAGGGPVSFLVAGGLALSAYAGGGYVLGEAMRGGTPLSGRISRLIGFAGVGAGALGLFGEAFAAFGSGGGYAGSALSTLAWLVAPPGLFYLEAARARRRFRRYQRAECARCGERGGSLGAVCPRCEAAPPRLCHRCRRFSVVRLGEACPSCRAVIGRRCWRCQYDWTGASGRCPECGVWKPAPETTDAGESAIAREEGAASAFPSPQ